MSYEQDIRTLLVAAAVPGIAERWFRDRAPDSEPLPYGTVVPDISRVPTIRGDGRTLRWRRLVQVDLWQQRPSPQSGEVEDLTLVEYVVSALDGVRIPSLSATRLYVQSATRLLEEELELVHHALTVSTHHR